MKALVGAFIQEKALVGAFSVIVKTGCGTDGSFYSTNYNRRHNHKTLGGLLQLSSAAVSRTLAVLTIATITRKVYI